MDAAGGRVATCGELEAVYVWRLSWFHVERKVVFYLGLGPVLIAGNVDALERYVFRAYNHIMIRLDELIVWLSDVFQR